MTTGEKIKHLRTQQGLTQDQLASMTGIHPVTIRKYEINKIQPTPAQIRKIADALGIGSIALSGVDKSGLRIETLGDLKGILMALYNVGIISVLGNRDTNNRLITETIKITFNPRLSPFLKLNCCTENISNVQISDLTLIIKNEDILNEFLDWERHKYLYQTFLDECDPEDTSAQEELRKYERTICKIELEMQKTQILLNGF